MLQLSDWCAKNGHPLSRDRKSAFSLFSHIVKNRAKEKENKDLTRKQIMQIWKIADQEVIQKYKIKQ